MAGRGHLSSNSEALWSRAFGIVWLFTFVVFFAAFQLFPTAPLRLLDLGASRGESGTFLATFTLGSSLGALVTGPLGDRFGHRRMLRVSAGFLTVVMFAYARMPVRWGFYVLAPLHGAVWSALLTSSNALVGGILPADARARGMSIFGLASPSGTILGPTVGVWIYDRWGFSIMCLLLAGAFGALMLGGRALPADDKHRARPERIVVRPDASVLPLAIILFFLAVGYGALSTYSTQEGLAHAFRFCAHSWPSAFLSCLGVGMVLMRGFMGVLGFGRRPERLLPGMVLLSLSGLCLLAFAPGGIARHVVSGLLYGAGYSMVFTLLNTILLGTVPSERRGAAFGTFVFAFDAGIGLGSFGLGRVIGRWGFHAGWTVAVFVLILGLPSALRVARRQSSLPR